MSFCGEILARRLNPVSAAKPLHLSGETGARHAISHMLNYTVAEDDIETTIIVTCDITGISLCCISVKSRLGMAPFGKISYC